METRKLSKETKSKIMKCAAVILRMHGEIVGLRTCQDWSGDKNQNPKNYFTAVERDDINFNSELTNSNLMDYEEGEDFFHDEMSVSFTMADALELMSEE